MTVRAENRWRKRLTKEANAEERARHDGEVVASMNRIPLNLDHATLLGDGVIRYDEKGHVWLMNKRESGWGSFGREYLNLRQVMHRYDIVILGFGQDKCSFFAEFRRAQPGERRPFGIDPGIVARRREQLEHNRNPWRRS